MRKMLLPRAGLSLSRKTRLQERRSSPIPQRGRQLGNKRRASNISEQRLILTRRRKMEIQMIEKQVHGNGVVQGDLHHGIGGDYFDVLALGGNFQFLHGLEKNFPNLLLAVSVYHRKARLLLHLVGKLIVREVRRNNFHRRVNEQDNDRYDDNGLKPAFSAFGTAERGITVISDASQVQAIHLPEPLLPQRLTIQHGAAQ